MIFWVFLGGNFGIFDNLSLKKIFEIICWRLLVSIRIVGEIWSELVSERVFGLEFSLEKSG